MRRGLVNLTKEQIEFVKINFNTMSNAEMARRFNIIYSTFCTKVHALGLRRMEMEYWTPEQVRFLQSAYHKMGDKELASFFEKRWPKKKRWTIKHIEKKRGYLGLNRTPEDLKKIRRRNQDRGCWQNMKTWDTRRAAPIGNVRVWRNDKGKYPFLVIKTDRGFLLHARWVYEKHFGKIPEGFIIVHKDGNSLNNDIDNLKAIHRAEARRGMNKYPEHVRKLERMLYQLNTSINKMK